jgi:hypothetical protein
MNVLNCIWKACCIQCFAKFIPVSMNLILEFSLIFFNFNDLQVFSFKFLNVFCKFYNILTWILLLHYVENWISNCWRPTLSKVWILRRCLIRNLRKSVTRWPQILTWALNSSIAFLVDLLLGHSRPIRLIVKIIK